jgi:hypothetical protein
LFIGIKNVVSGVHNRLRLVVLDRSIVVEGVLDLFSVLDVGFENRVFLLLVAGDGLSISLFFLKIRYGLHSFLLNFFFIKSFLFQLSLLELFIHIQF